MATALLQAISAMTLQISHPSWHTVFLSLEVGDGVGCKKMLLKCKHGYCVLGQTIYEMYMLFILYIYLFQNNFIFNERCYDRIFIRKNKVLLKWDK